MDALRLAAGTAGIAAITLLLLVIQLHVDSHALLWG